MTSPFNWRGRPSELAKELQRDAVKARNAGGGALKPRTYNTYQKAVPNVFTQKA